MTWAARRRFIILLIAGAIVLAFVAIIGVATFYKTPSCTDGVQNQNEAGIDCGGPCAYLCTALKQPPVVLYTKVLDNGAGRTDVVALVQNKNINAAAKNVPYTITLYGANHAFLQQLDGTLDLPPGTTMPVYVTGVGTGNQKVASAFLEVAASVPHWFTMTTDPRIVPMVLRTERSGSTDAPRIEATLANPSAITLSNVHALVLVLDAQKSVIAASATVIPMLAAQDQATATFTWNHAFAGVPKSFEVIPIIPLP